jgi:hypothetical protein
MTSSAIFVCSDRPVVDLFDGIKQLLEFAYQLLISYHRIVSLVLPALLPVLGFIAFVLKNGGIVVGKDTCSPHHVGMLTSIIGDKENHRPTYHSAMLLHMLFIASAIYCGIDMLTTLIEVDKSSIKKMIQEHLTAPLRLSLRSLMMHMIGFASTAVLLRNGSLSHPFLLADNRHYTFYLWARILQYPHIRYV